MAIAGSSDPGGHGPVILPRTIRVLGEQALPAPRRMTPARFSSGADDGLQVDGRGVVQGFPFAEAALFFGSGQSLDEVARGETHECGGDLGADPGETTNCVAEAAASAEVTRRRETLRK